MRSERLLFGKRDYKRREMASLTKIMMPRGWTWEPPRVLAAWLAPLLSSNSLQSIIFTIYYTEWCSLAAMMQLIWSHNSEDFS
jgi:hypothetical protein